MSTSTERQLVPIRIENPGEILMTGLSGEFNSPKGIPELWQEFVPYLGKIPSQVGPIAYGIIINHDPTSEKFDYMAAVRVNSFADVPTQLKKLPIPAYKYKVFRHDGHVTQLSSTIEKLCGMGVVTPSLPLSAGKSLGLLEYYGEHFNPQTGLGDMEVWVPFKE